MAEREGDFVHIDGLEMHREGYDDVVRVAEAKGVSKTRVLNNAARTEALVVDLIDRGFLVVVLFPGARIFAGRVYGRILGEMDLRNYKPTDDPEELPPNVIAFPIKPR